MADEREQEQSPAKDRDERVSIPLDPEKALRGLLKVDPESPTADERINDPDVTKGHVRGKPNT